MKTRYPSTVASLIVPAFFLSCSASSVAAFSARARAWIILQARLTSERTSSSGGTCGGTSLIFRAR